MKWPEEKHPKKTRYALIEAFRKLPVLSVITILLVGYIILNASFGIFYMLFDALGDQATKLSDYFYFSFVTGTTIGFGDFHPPQKDCDIAKIIVVIHGICSTFYFAMMVAFLGVKILFPHHTLHFSKNIIFDGKRFIVRLLNSHRALFVNPEIRVVVVAHCYGNIIAPNKSARKIDDLHWLDNHDFSFDFPNLIKKSFCISEEWEKAKDHTGEEESRFKIRISITGNYGMQQYTQVVSYGKDDIVEGKNFKPIQYNKEDKKVWRNINFMKFGDFWNNFDSIEK